MTPFEMAFIIFGMGVLYALIFKVIVYEIGGMREAMQKSKALQKEARDLNKKYIEAAKSGREREMKMYEEKISSLTGEMLKIQMKPMLLMIPILLASSLVVGFLRDNFTGFEIVLPVALPVPRLSFPDFLQFRDTFGPIGLFWLSFIMFNLLAQFIQRGAMNGKKTG